MDAAVRELAQHDARQHGHPSGPRARRPGAELFGWNPGFDHGAHAGGELGDTLRTTCTAIAAEVVVDEGFVDAPGEPESHAGGGEPRVANSGCSQDGLAGVRAGAGASGHN